MRKILFYPDVQIPEHNSFQVRALNRFLGYWQPDECIIIGDFQHFDAPSTWSKATAAEFRGSVMQECEIGKRVLADIRVGYTGPIKFISGNHDERPDLYLAKYAPALAESKAFAIETLLDFDSFGVTLAPPFYDFAEGWTATHGHLGISLSEVAGKSAMGAANKLGRSIVMGHTHRLGHIRETTGRDGLYHTLEGVEVGHVMDMRPGHVPDWLKGGFANWQAGFAYAYSEGDYTTVHTVPMSDDGSFIFEGEVHNSHGRRLEPVL